MFPTLKEVSLVREVAYKQIVTKCHMSYDFYKNKQGAMLKKKKNNKVRIYVIKSLLENV